MVLSGFLAKEGGSCQWSKSSVEVNGHGVKEVVLVVEVTKVNISVDEQSSSPYFILTRWHSLLPFTLLHTFFGNGRNFFNNIISR